MLMSAIYASSSPLLREDLWNYLIDIGHLISMPWILIGDFNQILYLEEKKSGSMVVQRRIQPFRDMVQSCDLFNLGFSGPPE